MFLSKVYPQLRNGLPKTFGDNLIPQRSSSVAAVAEALPSTQTAVPDKLYKKIELELRGNEPAVMESYGKFATMAAGHLGIPVGRNMAITDVHGKPKAVHERLTVLKSVHVHKKHRVQYETRTYFRYVDFFRMTGSTADTFLEYLERNLPEGVAMKVTKVEIRRILDSANTPNN